MRLSIAFFFLLSFLSLSGQSSDWEERVDSVWQLAEAAETYPEAITILTARINDLAQRNSEMNKESIELYRRMALMYKYSGDYYTALDYIETYYQLYESADSIPLTYKARAEYLRGEILYDLKLFNACQAWYDRALTTLTEAMASGDSTGRNQHRIQYFITHAADVAVRNQDFGRAELLTNSFPSVNNRYRAIIGNEKSDDYLTENIMARGFNLQKQERFEDARAVYDIALQGPLNHSLNKYVKRNLRIMRGNYANSFVEQGDYLSAEPLVRAQIAASLPLAINSPELADKALSDYGYLLNTLQGLGKYDEVPSVLHNAVALRYTIDSTAKGRNLGLVYTFAAKAAARQNNFARADSLFSHALYAFVDDAQRIGPARLPKILNNLIYGQEEFLYFLSEYRDAFLLQADQDLPDALHNALATSLTIDSLIYQGNSQLSLLSSVGRFLGLENRHFAKSIDIALQLYKQTDKERYLHEAFGFVSRQKSNLLRRYLTGPQLAESFGVPQDLIDQKIRLETETLITEQALAAAENANKQSQRARLLAVQHELSELRRTLENDYPRFSRALSGAATFDPGVTQSTLTENQLVVEYFLSADSLYAFTLSAGGMEYFVSRLPDGLAKTIDSFLNTPSAAAELYDFLIAPALAGKPEITRLQLIPDGALWRIPFSALQNNGNLLTRTVAVSYAYSSPLLFAAADSPLPAGGYLGIGMSYKDIVQRIETSKNRSATDRQLRNMGPLPYARREVEDAEALLDGNTLFDGDATRANFFRDAPSYGILHLAMHGILRNNPMESALVFRGDDTPYDLVRMQDILGTDLPARLTVLSACHSGNGPVETAEGMQSIGLAFTAAGSRATITSNWAARDAATYAILQYTFKRIEAGDPTDVALQKAVNNYLEGGTSADREPINWAHLSLIGSVDAVAPKSTNWWLIPGLLAGVLIIAGITRVAFRARPQVQ